MEIIVVSLMFKPRVQVFTWTEVFLRPLRTVKSMTSLIKRNVYGAGDGSVFVTVEWR